MLVCSQACYILNVLNVLNVVMRWFAILNPSDQLFAVVLNVLDEKPNLADINRIRHVQSTCGLLLYRNCIIDRVYISHQCTGRLDD